MAVLMFLKGFNEGSVVPLDGDHFTLGRSQQCQVWINVPAVSREHAIIRRIQGKYYIEDNKSRNHTFVNNKEVVSRTLLRDTDRIKICDIVLGYFENAPKAALPEEFIKAEPEHDDDTSTVKASIAGTSKQVIEAATAERLKLLMGIGENLIQTLTLDELLQKIVASLFQVFRQADRGFIILEEDAKLIPKVNKTRRENDDGAARFSRRIVRRCLETGECLLSEDATSDQRFDLSQSISDARIRSMMCAPLFGKTTGKPFGVVQLDTQDRFDSFTQEDMKLLLAVASQAAIAIENARMHETIVARAGLERDLQLARSVQKSFLPKKPPDVTGYQFCGYYEPAQEVGGDYYDFIPITGNRWGAMIGDVAGKGVPAALMMAKVRAEARFSCITEQSLGEVVGKLNEQLEDASEIDRFVTFLGSIVDPATHKVTFANAGHIPPQIYRKATDSFEEGMGSDLSGFPLGVVQGMPYESAEVSLSPGDVVILFTDGVTEAVNKEGRELKLEGALSSLKSVEKTPRAILDHLVATVKQHAAGMKPHDDITIVVYGRLG